MAARQFLRFVARDEDVERERWIMGNGASSALSECLEQLYGMRTLSDATWWEKEIELPRLIRELEIARAHIDHMKIKRHTV